MIQKKKSFLNRLRRIYSRFLRKIVLTGPAYLQDILQRHYNSQSMEACLRQLKDRGFNPGMIIDCGAYVGDWTKMVKKVFPDARVIMIEPQENKRPMLTQVQSEFSPTVESINCLLGPNDKEAIAFFEMESGSSVLEEMTAHPRKMVKLPMRTLDSIILEKKITGGIFLKLDVQGFEIEVLKGAKATIQKTDLILLETSLLQCNKSAPLFNEVIQYMNDQGFFAYDVCNLQRWRDNILLQMDVFFVRKDSAFRNSELLIKESPFSN
jgi:FkbM family methyltransferase